MPDSEQFSQVELVRWLRRLEQTWERDFKHLNDRLDHLTFVDKTLYDRDYKVLEDRVKALETRDEKDKQWNKDLLIQAILVPLIIGVMVAVIVAVILT